MDRSTDTTQIAVRSLGHSPFWIINFGAIAVCFLSGPFGTLEALPSGFRLIYWGLIVLVTSMLALWLHTFLRLRDKVSVLVIIAVSMCFGFLVAGIVLVLSLALLQPIDRYPGNIELVSYSFPSAAIIFLLSALVMRSMAVPKLVDQKTRPALLDRLEKFPHAQQILSLSAQDHYVEVTTEIGTELCLMRLSDAIAKVEPIKGFQIHRSHWIAASAIKSIDAKGTATHALLVDGRTLSISQSRLADFKEFLQAA